ncbi:MAG: cytochrome c maturation protein CcmE [Planctomycetes bacterium]|nr:cytochrome c maturation protein CcmE [Planctomycetota bacterium]
MNLKVVIVILLFASAVTGAVVLALLEGGVEYRTVPHLLSDAYSGERVKLKGQVVQVHREFKPAQFTVVDIPEGNAAPGPSCRVIYEGDDVPQGLKKAAHVTLEGRYDRRRGAFVATLVQTQCPSRYEGQQLPAIEPAAP